MTFFLCNREKVIFTKEFWEDKYFGVTNVFHGQNAGFDLLLIEFEDGFVVLSRKKSKLIPNLENDPIIDSINVKKRNDWHWQVTFPKEEDADFDFVFNLTKNLNLFEKTLETPVIFN